MEGHSRFIMEDLWKRKQHMHFPAGYRERGRLSSCRTNRPRVAWTKWNQSSLFTYDWCCCRKKAEQLHDEPRIQNVGPLLTLEETRVGSSTSRQRPYPRKIISSMYYT